jgi:glutamate mutase epsilon subunit
MNCAQFEALSEQFWTTLVNLIFSHSKLFKSEDLADIFQQIKTLKTLKLNGDDIILYGTKVKKVLETELAFFAKPSDWGLDQESMCSCDDCKRFNIFLTSQVTETRVMSIPLASRKHLINLVEVMKAPVSAEVDRSSSPHKLVLTKTSGTHKYRKERAAAILKASSWF